MFPAPSPFLQETPLCLSLDDAFRLTPLNPQPKLRGESWSHQRSPQHLARFPLRRGQTLRHKRNQSWLSWPAHRLPVQVFAAGLPAGGRVACSSALTSPGGGQARPAGTRQGCCGFTPCSCQSAFPGTLGSGCGNCKTDPLGTEGAVSKTPKMKLRLVPGSQPEHGSQTCHTPDGWAPVSNKPTPSITCKPPPVFLHGYTIQLPCALGTLVTESRHQDNRPILALISPS